MEYLKIKNWDRWQSYRADRGQPPWIKIHRCVMRNPEWVELTDSERGQLVAIWLLAADNNGLIPSSPVLIQKLCFMTTPLKLNRFIDLGFICQSDANLTPERRQPDSPEKSRVEKSRVEKNKEPFMSDSIEYRLSDYLYRFILDRNPKVKKPNLQQWAKEVDLMIRLDKRQSDEIREIIKWCQNDSFWQKNILSTQTLRKKFDRLWLEIHPSKPAEPEKIYEDF